MNRVGVFRNVRAAIGGAFGGAVGGFLVACSLAAWRDDAIVNYLPFVLLTTVGSMISILLFVMASPGESSLASEAHITGERIVARLRIPQMVGWVTIVLGFLFSWLGLMRGEVAVGSGGLALFLCVGGLCVMLGGVIEMGPSCVRCQNGFGVFGMKWRDVSSIETNSSRSAFVLCSGLKRLPLEFEFCMPGIRQRLSDAVLAQADALGVEILVLSGMKRFPRNVRVGKGEL